MHDGDIHVMDGTFHEFYMTKLPGNDELGDGNHLQLTWYWITKHASN